MGREILVAHLALFQYLIPALRDLFVRLDFCSCSRDDFLRALFGRPVSHAHDTIKVSILAP